MENALLKKYWIFVIHDFQEYPSSFWKQQDSDTPLRTFKTVLHTMVKCKGTDLYVHIRKVANHPGENSELVCYANKLFKVSIAANRNFSLLQGCWSAMKYFLPDSNGVDASSP